MAGVLPTHPAGPWGLHVPARVSLPAHHCLRVLCPPSTDKAAWSAGGTGGGLMSTLTVSMGAAVRHNGKRGLAGGGGTGATTASQALETKL